MATQEVEPSKVPPRASSSVEDYTKAIFKLAEQRDAPVTTSSLAQGLGISAASASGMLRRLQERRLVKHERYGDITLTEEGRQLALSVLRRHRLIELYLVEALGYTWDEVHDEAEVLEHVVSQKLLERIAAKLGQPLRDPHGDPIPTAEGEVIEPEHETLSSLPPGTVGRIVRVRDDDSALLRYLTEHSINLDDRVEILERKPFGGPFIIRVGSPPETAEHAIGEGVADALCVSVTE